MIYLSTLRERHTDREVDKHTERKIEKIKENKRKERKRKELTRIMNLIAAHPEVAMTFALLGTRLKSVGTMASAP